MEVQDINAKLKASNKHSQKAHKTSITKVIYKLKKRKKERKKNCLQTGTQKTQHANQRRLNIMHTNNHIYNR